MKLTKEQSEAIYDRGNNILVSAAAGSGKTSVLVERIFQKVVKDKVNIDDLLIVTFTKAAASEMKERLILKIEDYLKENNNDNFFREQLVRINAAQISTIDSFCLKVVKENFKTLDIEPKFRLEGLGGGSNEIEVLKLEVLDEFLEIYYEKNDEDFLKLVECFSSYSSDNEFKKVFLKIYENAKNTPYPKIWLENSCLDYKISNEEDFFNSSTFKQIIIYSKETLEDLLLIKNYIDEILILFKEKKEKIQKFLDDEFNNYKEALFYIEEKNFKGFYEHIKSIKFGRISLKELDSELDFKEEVKYLRDLAKKIFNDLKDIFFGEEIEKIIEENKVIFSVIPKFITMILEFDEYFLNIKKEKNIFSFNDISHFCIKILISENFEPTDVALNYRNKFNEIFTDEYQDSNFLQEEILNIISTGKNRFMVGDIKQCIYRFRQANPKIFNEKYIEYFSDNSKGKRIDLNANFRSNENVVECINFIFQKIMNEKLGEVKYDDYAKLKKIQPFYNLNKNENLSKNCELNVINTDYNTNIEENSKLDELNKQELEAHFIANRIKNLIEVEKLQILKNNSYCNVDYKDIAILLRSSDLTEVLIKVFQQYNIPIYAENNSNFFEISEVAIIINLLKIIDNPLQDIPLISVLYSNIFNFSANELMKIKLNSKKTLFYHSILNYLSNENIDKDEKIIIKINNFIEKIDKWAKISKSLKIYELLSLIYNETNYYSYVGTLIEGDLKQANLFSLIERAIDFEGSNLSGIFEFVNYIEKIKNLAIKSSQVTTYSNNENCVKVMTIHKSKGLEFPVVFLSNIFKKFNTQDEKEKILFDYDYKLGVSINYKEDIKNDIPIRYKINSIQRKVIKEKINKEATSEELRILYVALTRAKEKLILTGTIKEKSLSNLTISSNIINKSLHLSSIFLTCNNYGKWIYSCLNKEENSGWELNYYNNDNIKITNYENSPEKIKNSNIFDENVLKLFNLDKKLSIEKEKIISENLNWKYPFEFEKDLETSLTVSEIKRKLELTFEHSFKENFIKNIANNENEFDDAQYNLPKFYANKEQEVSPLIRGTLYHTILEHLDLNISSQKELDNFIKELILKGIICKEEIELVDTKKIMLFLKSDLAKRILKSNLVKKEAPFKLGVKPIEIYFDKKLKNSNVNIIVNGIIDLFFEEDNEIVVVDYKTDKITDENILKQRYKVQMDIYKKAIEMFTDKKVKECILYLVMHGKHIIMK